MYNPFAVALLALEAQKVVELRLMKLASGSAAGWAEAEQMVSEKVSALIEASGTLMMGGSCETVVAAIASMWPQTRSV